MIHAVPHLADPYEAGRVAVRNSELAGAGEGVFALRDLPADTVACFYHGLYLQPEETSPANNQDYQIYTDWDSAPASSYLDLPDGARELTGYRASLGHKVNHSWEANCVYSREVEHPVFGNTVLAVRTARPIARGEELFCNYRYD